jgi:hypothetical protein
LQAATAGTPTRQRISASGLVPASSLQLCRLHQAAACDSYGDCHHCKRHSLTLALTQLQENHPHKHVSHLSDSCSTSHTGRQLHVCRRARSRLRIWGGGMVPAAVCCLPLVLGKAEQHGNHTAKHLSLVKLPQHMLAQLAHCCCLATPEWSCRKTLPRPRCPFLTPAFAPPQ